MSVTDSPTTGTTTVLTELECWDLLQQHDFGRIAVGAHAELAIYPVNYRVVDGRIRILTAPGSKLVSILLDPFVAFEIDDRVGDGAWSVLVKGSAEPVTLSPNPRVQPALPTPFVTTPKHTIVEITPTDISGRTFSR